MSTADATAAGHALGASTRRPLVSVAALWTMIGVALPSVASMAAGLGAVDLAYQVRLGDGLWVTHALPRVDTLTFTAAGRAWTDQQWLAQVTLSLVHRVGGWGGLIVLRTALIAVTFCFVYAACREAGARRRTSSLLALGSFGASMLGLALRPQLFAFALFAASVWALVGRRRRPALVWIVPAFTVVWVNVHGSFFLAPALLALAWLEDRAEPAGRTLMLATAASVAATAVNPFGAGVWTYVVSIASNPTIARTVSEWAPPTIRDPAGIAFFASVAATAALFARRTRPVPAWTLVTLALFLGLGLQSGRGMFWWDLLLPSVVASLLPASDSTDDMRSAPLPMAVTVTVTVVAVAVLFFPWFRPGGASSPALLRDAPARLTEHVAAASPGPSRVFNAQRIGSWLEWALPADRVFVDSRIELFTPDEWHDYETVSAGLEGWQGVLDRWRVDVVVATRDQQAELIPRIQSDPGWRLAYRDRDGYVFVRA